MSPTRNSAISRRRFVSTTAVGTVAAFAAPAVMTASKTDSVTVVGEGDYQYEVIHAWPQLPEKYTWQTTHNVAVDKSGNVYVIHEGRKEQKDHPSIFVFDPEGRFVRAFGSQFQGGGHGIEIRTEGSEEFVYACGYQNIKAISKLTLTGDVVWHKRAPMESGVYAAGEDRSNRPEWGQDRFLPTNFTFLPDGDFLLIDGYGDMDTAKEFLEKKHILRRLGQPEEIARAAVFLASEQSSFMTGSDLLIDGGYAAR